MCFKISVDGRKATSEIIGDYSFWHHEPFYIKVSRCVSKLTDIDKIDWCNLIDTSFVMRGMTNSTIIQKLKITRN